MTNRPPIDFPETISRVAVLALEGAPPGDLSAALTLASRYDDDPWGIAVDGGLAAFRAIGRSPGLVAGDFDSVGKPPRGIAVARYPTAKDFSDFSGALGEAVRRRVHLVVVAGLLGGRVDHEWANLFEAGSRAKRFVAIVSIGERGLVVITARGARVRLASRSLISVFALGGATRVSLSGTRWRLSKRRLVPGSLGLSNLSRGTVVLAVHSGVAALVVPSRNSKTSRATRARSSTTVP